MRRRYTKILSIILAAALTFGGPSMSVQAVSAAEINNTYDSAGASSEGSTGDATSEASTEKPGTEKPTTEKPTTENATAGATSGASTENSTTDASIDDASAEAASGESGDGASSEAATEESAADTSAEASTEGSSAEESAGDASSEASSEELLIEDMSSSQGSSVEIEHIRDVGVGPAYIYELTEEDVISELETKLGDKIYEYPEAPAAGLMQGSSESAIISTIRNAMVKRSSSVSFTYSGTNIRPLFEKAMEEKTLQDELSPKTGDYLLSHYGGYSASASGCGGDWNWTVSLYYLNDNYNSLSAATQEKQVDAKVDEIVYDLGLNDSSLTDEQIIKKIHDYLVDTIEYTNDNTRHCHTAHAALIDGACVCQGYSSAFLRLCREAGVAARYIVGMRINHAWNIVRVPDDEGTDACWYNMDVTWDDPITYGGQNYLRYDYYLKNDLDFIDHPRDDKYRTDDFEDRHTIAKYSWGEDTAGKYLDNPVVTFRGLDGNSYTSEAQGKPRIIVFFDATSGTGKGSNIVKDLAGGKLVKSGKIDLMIADTSDASPEKYNEYIEKNNIGSNVICVYDDSITADGTQYSSCAGYFNYLYYRGTGEANVVMIDEDSELRFVMLASASSDEYQTQYEVGTTVLDRMYMQYLKNGWVPGLDTKSVEIRKFDSPEDYGSGTGFTVLQAGSTLKVKCGDVFFLKGVGIASKTNVPEGGFDASCLMTYDDPSGLIDYDSETGMITINSTDNLRANKSETVSFSFLSNFNSNVQTTLKVTASPTPVTKMAYDGESIEMISSGNTRESRKAVSLTYQPVVTSDDISGVAWTSSDENVVRVVGNGMSADIIAVAKETAAASVTAAFTSGAGKKFTVKIPVQVNFPIKLDKKTMILTAKAGVASKITAECADDEYDADQLQWDIDNGSIATLSPAVGAEVTVTPNTSIDETGTAVITATTQDGEYTAECLLTVNPVSKVSTPYSYPATGEDGTLTVKKGTKVLLLCDTVGSSVYVKADGADDYELNRDALVINSDTTVTLMGKKDGLRNSDPVTLTFNVSRDWGEIPEDDDTQDIRADFDGDATEVPEGLWYVVDGHVVKDGTASVAERTYAAGKITFNADVRVYHGTRRLIENRDYTISYSNNTASAGPDSAKAPTVTVKGKGSYTKSRAFKFTIKKQNINMAGLTSEKELAIKEGSVLGNTKPALVYNGKKLVLNTDYVLEYYDVTDSEDGVLIDEPSKCKAEAGRKYEMHIIAKADDPVKNKVCNYSGEFSVKPSISVLPAADKSVASASGLKLYGAGRKAAKIPYSTAVLDPDSLFDGAEPLLTVYDGKELLKYKEDFEAELPEGISAEDASVAGKHNIVIKGTARALSEDDRANGRKSYVGNKTLSYEITGIAMSKVKTAGLLTSVEYSGSDIRLSDLFNPAEKNLTAHNGKSAEEDKWNEVTLYRVINKVDVPLEHGKDYTCEMVNTGVLGKFSLVFRGKGEYTGTIKKTITVKTYNLAETKKSVGDKKVRIELESASVPYRKAGAKPAVTVTFGGKTLREGIDYTLSYKNNTKIVDTEEALGKLKATARPMVVVKGMGNFTGTNQTVNFLITKPLISECVVLSAADVAYNPKGKAGYFFATPKIMDGGKTLTAGKNKDVEPVSKKDYVYTYVNDTVLLDEYGLESNVERYAGETVLATDRVPIGTVIRVSANVVCKDKSPYVSAANGTEICGYYTVIDGARNIKNAKVSLVKESVNAGVFSFNNAEEIVPLKADDLVVTMKVKIGGISETVTLSDSDYSIVSVTNNRFKGTATVLIKGCGDYGGTKTFTFKVKAKGMS